MAKRLSTKDKNAELASSGKKLNHFGIVLRIYPNKEQVLQIDKTIGCARFTYNNYLYERQEYYKATGKTLSVAEYKKSFLVQMKQTKEYAFLKEIDKFALESAVENVDAAYSRFFNKLGRFPRFKSKRKAKKAYTTYFTNNNIEINGSSIKLPKLKWIKFNNGKVSDNLKKVLSGQASIKKATITEKAGKYYVSVLCEEVIHIVEPLDIVDIDLSKAIGIDLGVSDFAIISNGLDSEKVANPKHLIQSQDKLAKLQRRLAKKQKGSKNFIKAKNKVAKTHVDIQNQRTDFAHQLSRRLVNENQVIVIEDLNIKSMVRNKNLSKAISDASWSRFASYLDYKLEKEGKYLVKIDRWFPSSKTCSVCGEKNKTLTLDQREWTCSSCGTLLDRDVNAAVNIRKEGLKLLGIAA